MTAFRKPLQALTGLVVAGLVVFGVAAPALAAPPFPAGAEATALVGGTPLVKAICPANSSGQVKSGTSTLGGVSVGSPAGARCTNQSASADGFYAIAGVTPPLPGTLRFSSGCQNSTGQNGGGVDVPAGTFVTGIGVVATKTTVTTPNTLVTYPGGQMAILNEVIVDATSVQRNAIRFTSGPNTGTIVGQVLCGVKYPLVVDTPSGATAADLGAPSPIGDSGDGSIVPWVVAAIGLLLIAQLALGRQIWHRRRPASEA